MKTTQADITRDCILMALYACFDSAFVFESPADTDDYVGRAVQANDVFETCIMLHDNDFGLLAESGILKGIGIAADTCDGRNDDAIDDSLDGQRDEFSPATLRRLSKAKHDCYRTIAKALNDYVKAVDAIPEVAAKR